MTIVSTGAKIIVDGEQTFLCLAVNRWDAKRAVDMARGKRNIEITPHREKRSLNANNYFWQLIGKLQDALDIPKNEIYLNYVKEIGVYKDFQLTEEEAKTFRYAWEHNGTAWPTEQMDYTPDGERVIIRAYYGSSVYNTHQMSRLIDHAVQDCKALDIETLPPEKLTSMLERWEPKK